MDAVNFIKTMQRMCLSFQGSNCNNEKGEFCPLKDFTCDLNEIPAGEMKATVSKVEEWGKAHPARTRASELKKLFPSVVCSEDGTPDVCCLSFNGGTCPGRDKDCFGCRKKFWNEEIEED